MGDDDLVVQRLIAVVQLFEVDVLVEVVVESTHLLVGARGLLFERFNSCGKITHQPEALALVDSEGSPAVCQGIGNDLRFRWHAQVVSGSAFSVDQLHTAASVNLLTFAQRIPGNGAAS